MARDHLCLFTALHKDKGFCILRQGFDLIVEGLVDCKHMCNVFSTILCMSV